MKNASVNGKFVFCVPQRSEALLMRPIFWKITGMLRMYSTGGRAGRVELSDAQRACAWLL
jgi:hypothetical protein